MKFFLGFIFLGVLSGCADPAEESEPTLVQSFMADDNALIRGQAIYAGSCADFCHGLTPELSALDFGDDANLFNCLWQYGETDEEIFGSIVNGISGTRMVGFGSNFPEVDDPWKIIAYLRVNQSSCVSELENTQ
jgi:mono/diheme cytochrome c family protein|tara:strand:+ start:27 stop:428 length:402 start_codon:yes stop_codon:yes gene_type:complete